MFVRFRVQGLGLSGKMLSVSSEVSSSRTRADVGKCIYECMHVCVYYALCIYIYIFISHM